MITIFLIVTCLWLASPAAGADERPLVVELWPDTVPDEVAGMFGPEKVVMSPKLDLTQVEVTESTRMLTNVTRPSVTMLSIPKGTPPVFLVHGGNDLISPPEHSVLMYLALRRQGIPAELHVYANTAHDFAIRSSDRPFSAWTQSCTNWLRQQGFFATSRVEP